MMNIHCLQHVPFEGPAYIRQWATESKSRITETCFYLPEFKLPALSEFDVLIVLGGPMSVHDEHLFQWLNAEKKFIKESIDAGKKVIGICLGAQLIAHCMGAKVNLAKNREIGWFPVYPESENSISGLFKSHPEVFHWHGEVFDVPEGGITLLRSQANPNQAFSYGRQVLGLQFHLEMNQPSIEGLILHAPAEDHSLPFVQSADQMLDQVVERTATLNKIAKTLFDSFLLDAES